MKISNVASIVNTKIDASILTTHTYISTECMLPNCGGIENCSSIPNGKVTSFDKNDILLSNIRPYFKKLWFSTRSGGCSNDVICLRVANRACLPKYLYYALCTDEFIDSFSASSKGTKMPRGDKNALLTYEIPDRNIEDQLHIVDILGTLDEKMEYYNTLKQKTVQLGSQIYASISAKGTEKSLGDIFKFTNGYTFKSKNYSPEGSHKVITIKNITERGFNAYSADKIKYKDDYKNSVLNIGDILLTMTGDVGRCGIVDEQNCLLNQRVLKLDSFSPFFTYFTLITYSKDIQNLAKGSVQQNLGLKELSKFSIPVADEQEYEEYNSIMEQLISISIAQQKLNELKQLYLKKFFG